MDATQATGARRRSPEPRRVAERNHAPLLVSERCWSGGRRLKGTMATAKCPGRLSWQAQDRRAGARQASRARTCSTYGRHAQRMVRPRGHPTRARLQRAHLVRGPSQEHYQRRRRRLRRKPGVVREVSGASAGTEREGKSAPGEEVGPSQCMPTACQYEPRAQATARRAGEDGSGIDANSNALRQRHALAPHSQHAPRCDGRKHPMRL